MKLIDAIFLSGQMGEGSVICACEPFGLSSESIIAQLEEDCSIPVQAKSDGFAYFLETNLVVELLEMIESKRASRATKGEFVCYYATHDAYPAWYYDLMDVRSLE